MKRVVCTEFGPSEALTIEDHPTPVAGAGEVVVAVEAAAVSFVDDLIVQGRYQLRPDLPFTPGSVVAGRIVSCGDDVTGVRPDDEVVALSMGFGGYASHLVLSATQVVPRPAGVDAATAAAATESYSTLVFAVTNRVVIRPGEQVVVLGAGGGIGLAAVDVARSLGARVVAVASTQDKRAAAVAAGADVALDYTDLKDAIRAATGGGADVVVDPVGGPSAEAALRALAAGGRFCVVGFASGEIPRLPANIVLLRNRSVVGVDWGDWARTDGAAAVALCGDVLARIGRGELRPPTPTQFALDEAPRALGLLRDRAVAGKLVLVP